MIWTIYLIKFVWTFDWYANILCYLFFMHKNINEVEEGWTSSKAWSNILTDGILPDKFEFKNNQELAAKDEIIFGSFEVI